MPFTEEVANVASDVVGRCFPHVQTFCMPPSTCVMGKCDKCGLGNVFARMNSGRVGRRLRVAGFKSSALRLRTGAS